MSNGYDSNFVYELQSLQEIRDVEVSTTKNVCATGQRRKFCEKLVGCSTRCEHVATTTFGRHRYLLATMPNLLAHTCTHALGERLRTVDMFLQ